MRRGLPASGAPCTSAPAFARATRERASASQAFHRCYSCRSFQVRRIQQLLQILGWLRFADQPCAADRMFEGNAPRMKGLPRKRPQRGGERVVFASRPERLSVLRIAHNRPSTRGEVNANLVRPARQKTAAEES